MSDSPPEAQPHPLPPPWDRVRALFEEALTWPESERETFLAASGADAATIAEVRSLLAHSGETDTAWLAPGSAKAGVEPAPREDVVPGQRFGAWRVRRRIGHGGMGEVYEAERADGQFEGRAAVKLLKRGMDSQAVLDRFALERSALARLSHPHIARLFDAGQSEAGLPYFVMEFVDGKPIDAAARGLALEAKLELFLQLADAVAHAHRNLLVHRDLKPGNVLVTADGQVKLLDFGIAKALDPPDTGDLAGATTLNAPRPFTPHYASPEQVRGEPATTTTDVYSLGVLLYELITGVRPTGRGATSAVEAARSVLEEQPTRPSALSADQVANPQWLATRKRLQGDLDNILLKALDKSREGRYLSVDAFAADIRAFLEGRPVSAQPPRALYLLSRFVRRHRTVVATAALALLGIVAAAVVALWQAHEAERQRALAEQRFNDVRRLANRLVFKYHDEIATLSGASKAREALLKDAGEFLDGLGAAARDDPGIAQELAGTWYRLSQLQGVDPIINIGQHSQAEQSLDKALDLARLYALRAATSTQALSEVVNMHVSRAELWQMRGELGKAEAVLRAALPLLDRALERDPRDSWALASAVSLHGVHARILGNQMNHAHLGRWQEACASADRARAAAEATAAADPKNKFIPDTLGFTMSEQAHCRVMSGRYLEADALFRRSRELRDEMSRRMPEDIDFQYQRAVMRAHQARLWSLLGRHDEARTLLDEAREQMRSAAAADSGNQAAARRLQALGLFDAELQWRRGDLGAARTTLARVLRDFPAGASRRYADIRLRGEALILAARVARLAAPALTEEALTHALEAGELLQAPRPGDDNRARHWMLAQALAEQAAALAGLGREADSKDVARRGLGEFGVSESTSIDDALPPLLRPDARALSVLAGIR